LYLTQNKRKVEKNQQEDKQEADEKLELMKAMKMNKS